ncbi:MAG TPA: xyloglucanase, partial [Capsulimonadaceae bacterium]|nr:xyloglucanase [Capsulimonadaceae bacterium]
MTTTQQVLRALIAPCLLAFFSCTAQAQNKQIPASKPAPPHITTPSSGPRYAWRNVEIGGGGGFVDGIVFHPKQADLIYCRTDIGGAYRWDGKLRRWIALTDWVGQDNGNLRGAESIAVDPTDPNRVYIAAGTYSRPEMKTAILSSTDQGRTWKQTPVPLEMGGNEDGRGIGERLAVDPNHPSTIYFGSRHDGLWKSDDYAATWQKVDSFPTVADNPARTQGGGFRFAPQRFAGVGWEVFDAASGKKGEPTPTLYVGVAAPTMPTLWESKDGGKNWQSVPGAPTGLIPHHAVLDSGGTLYLSYSNGIGPNGVTDGAVWKLNTKTGVWTDITPIKATPDSPSGFGGLALDAQHPGTVMVATLDHWKPADEIYRTTDGGAHWEAISPTATLDPTTAPWLYWGNAQPRFGWWFAALAIDPIHSGRVMYGTGATIWGTDDITPADSGRATQWRMYAEGVEETAVTALISPSAGPHLISGLGDIGGFTHHDLMVSPPEGMSSNPIFTTTSSLDFAEKNPSIVVRSGTGTDSHIKSGSSRGAYSLDGGNKWTPFPTEPTAPSANTPAGPFRGGGGG